jgi:hypothetical protein
VPLAAVCHDGSNTHPDWPAYDEAACTKLQQRWYVVLYSLYVCSNANIDLQDRPIITVRTTCRIFVYR